MSVEKITVATRAVTAFSSAPDARSAAAEIVAGIRNQMPDPPDVLLLFASTSVDTAVLSQAVQEGCRPRVFTGCSSAGEFAGSGQGGGSVSAVAISSPHMRFRLAAASGLREDRGATARAIADELAGQELPGFPHRTALVLTDALAGYTEDFVEQLTVATAGSYRFFGGGAGDDDRFGVTHVFAGERILTDAAAVLEIVSSKPVGIGVRHGWQPASSGFRVTEADGCRLISLNAEPAAEAWRQLAAGQERQFDTSAPLPFFLHHVIGMDTGAGYKLRVPLSVNEDESVNCAAEVPEGVSVRLMATSDQAAADSAVQATREALAQMGTHSPAAALLFDCAATRLRMGGNFRMEIGAVAAALPPGTALAGCNTYGQVARVDGQFSGFHNCTAVVCLLPE